MQFFESFLASFVTLFVIVDPLGTAAVFVGLTIAVTQVEQRQIAKRASLISLGLMLAFATFGAAFINLLGVTLPAFQAGGGLLLFWTAFRMVMGAHDTQNGGESVYRGDSDLAVFPLAIPLLCGPGCMTAVILLSKETANIADTASLYSAIIAVQLTAFICLYYAGHIFKFVSKTGVALVARVFGVVLAAMAVQFFVSGVYGLVQASP